jgi:hypothetical protein
MKEHRLYKNVNRLPHSLDEDISKLPDYSQFYCSCHNWHTYAQNDQVAAIEHQTHVLQMIHGIEK